MKDVVQIKAVLVENQHDALMSFYDSYPRLFVNKLLLKLCEGCLTEYPPSLAHFTTSQPAPDAKKRKVVIRLHKKLSPAFWDFYKELPHGARTVVLVNLMNHYAQLAEADMRLMDRVYWSSGPSLSSATLASTGPAITVPHATNEKTDGAKHSVVTKAEKSLVISGGTDQPMNADFGSRGAGSGKSGVILEEQEDPLASFEVSL
jgi:hypothetical protein